MNVSKLAVAMAVALGSLAGTVSASDSDALFVQAENRKQIAAPGEMLQAVAADPANARIDFVSVRAGLLDESKASVRLDLPGGLALEAERTAFEVMESGNQVWSGRIKLLREPTRGGDGLTPIDEQLDHITAVRSGDSVMANIRVGGALYRLLPVEDGAHVLVEVDQSRFLPDEDQRAYAQMVAASGPAVKPRADEPGLKAISTIRVMVAFGRAATSAVGNEQQATDLAFTEANNALAATNTDVRFQQAGPIQFYTQSESTNYTTMLSRLTNQSDGFYDAIGGQRNTNTADIVAYVAPVSSTLCGQAAGIGTSSANAYFVISSSCLSGNYTFVHEAGHVVGTRHDNDPTTTPFAYGHGYVMPSISRRTVMAVNNGPCPSCTRIGAFSSPNYTLSGVPIGTASFNDNTRVWRTRGPTVAAFR
jgi:hypothetical protein